MNETSARSESLPGLTSEGRAAEIERLVRQPLEAEGYEIVRVILSGEHRPKLQFMLERQGGEPVNVDECAAASRLIEAILDVEDPVSGPYVLEVSSPGIDRPLTRLSDFERFAGFEARVELRVRKNGRRRFRGRLLGVRNREVRLAVEDEEVAFDFADVAKAKLVMTDDLIAASHGGAMNG